MEVNALDKQGKGLFDLEHGENTSARKGKGHEMDRTPTNPYRGPILKMGKNAHFRACAVFGAYSNFSYFRAFTLRGYGEGPLFGHGQDTTSTPLKMLIPRIFHHIQHFLNHF